MTSPTKSGPSLSRIVILTAAGAFLDGYDLLIMGAALLLLVPHFHLGGAETGMLGSLPFLGMAIGSLFAGRLCDRIGRRRVYMIDIIFFAVCALLQAISQDVWQLVVMRCLIGVCIGFDMPTGSSLLAEFAAGHKKRGAITSFMNTAWVFGGMVAAIVGYILYRTTGHDAWRWMFASGAIPAVIIAIMRHSLPESPLWSNTRAKMDGGRSGSAYREIFRNRRNRRAVAFFGLYWAVDCFFGGPPAQIYTALIFSTVIMLSGANALLLSASLAVVYVIVSIISQFLTLDRFGRKPYAAVSCLVATVGALTTAFLQHGGLWLVVAFAFFAVATQTIPIPFWPWSTEQLPTHIRATGQSIGSAAGKGAQFLGVVIFTPAFVKHLGWLPYFLIVGAAFALLSAFVLFFGPETKSLKIAQLDETAAPMAGV